MKIHYNNWPVKRVWEEQDIREFMDSDAWDCLHLDNLSMDIDVIRELKDKINWDIQYYTLRDMYDRWDLKDQKFFHEFKEYIARTEDAWGPFGQVTGIYRDF